MDLRAKCDMGRMSFDLRFEDFLFVGNEQAGKNIAGVYALVATCEANSVNPVEYLRDVLLRVSKPGAALDDLLPHHWSPPN